MPIYIYIYIIYIYTCFLNHIHGWLVHVSIFQFLVENTGVHISFGGMYTWCQDFYHLKIHSFSLKESTQSNLVGWCLHRMYIGILWCSYIFRMEVLHRSRMYIFLALGGVTFNNPRQQLMVSCLAGEWDEKCWIKKSEQHFTICWWWAVSSELACESKNIWNGNSFERNGWTHRVRCSVPLIEIAARPTTQWNQANSKRKSFFSTQKSTRRIPNIHQSWECKVGISPKLPPQEMSGLIFRDYENPLVSLKFPWIIRYA